VGKKKWIRDAREATVAKQKEPPSFLRDPRFCFVFCLFLRVPLREWVVSGVKKKTQAVKPRGLCEEKKHLHLKDILLDVLIGRV